ncbi:MAG: CYTH domain-containing protein, partial [Alcaligenaceae bacterium]
MEIEFKFQVPEAALSALTAEIRTADSKKTRLQAFYFDTPARELAAHKIVLRVRKEGKNWVQTVKAQGDGLLHRLEHNVSRASAANSKIPPAPDLQLHADSPVWELIEKSLGRKTAVLTGLYNTDITRITRLIKSGSSTVELALDQGTIVSLADDPALRRSDSVSELELELADGTFGDLAAVARHWHSAV